MGKKKIREEKMKKKKEELAEMMKQKSVRDEFDMLDNYFDSEMEKVENKDDKIRLEEVDLFASPVPYLRHIEALEYCDPNPIFLPTLLYGKKISDEYLKIYHGPPGTGKTYTLINELKTLLKTTKRKIFVCAASNVGVLNLYNRAVKESIPCTLSININRLP